MFYYSNGFLIREYYNKLISPYKGVYGYCWPLLYAEVNNEENNELVFLTKYFNENIDKSWNKDYVDTCNDINYINRYAVASNRLNIKFDILFCMTTRRKPSFQNPNNYLIEKNFLGYDYAYPGGSFYSCVYYELITERIKDFSDIELNKNGLFETEEELKDFIKRREELANKNDPRLEKGEFIAYKLWNCNEVI